MRPMIEIPAEFSSAPCARMPVKKIHEMVVSCVKILDPEVQVDFVDFHKNHPTAEAFVEDGVICLPKEELRLEYILYLAFHELAHVWFTNPDVPNGLSDKEHRALKLLEEVRVNILFCRRHPEFRITFLRFYENRREEEPKADWDLMYSLWGPLEGFWSVAQGCRRLDQIGLIDELRAAVYAANSTSDLVPVARKLSLEL